jgi:hypothetical protein
MTLERPLENPPLRSRTRLTFVLAAEFVSLRQPEAGSPLWLKPACESWPVLA